MKRTPTLLTMTWHGQTASEALTQIGEWLEIQQHSDQASHYYEAALLANPACSIAAWRAGQLDMKDKRYQEAVIHFKQAAYLTPDHAPTFYQLSLAYAAVGEAVLALEASENALLNDSNNLGAFLQKLRSLAELKRWQDIQRMQRSFSPSTQISNEVYLWFALAEANLGDTDLALTLYTKVQPKTRKQYKEATQTLDRLTTSDVRFIEQEKEDKMA